MCYIGERITAIISSFDVAVVPFNSRLSIKRFCDCVMCCVVWQHDIVSYSKLYIYYNIYLPTYYILYYLRASWRDEKRATAVSMRWRTVCKGTTYTEDNSSSYMYKYCSHLTTVIYKLCIINKICSCVLS